MKGKLARCANCRKSTRYCASKGCHPVAPIQYEVKNDADITVRLDGRIAGRIAFGPEGYQYIPKGTRLGGDTFPSLEACKRSIEGTDEPETVPDTPVYDEREVAQWYAAAGYQVMRDELAALPDADRRKCFEYGGLVSWARLPKLAKDAIAKRRAEIIADGERIQAEIDARNAQPFTNGERFGRDGARALGLDPDAIAID